MRFATTTRARARARAWGYPTDSQIDSETRRRALGTSPRGIVRRDDATETTKNRQGIDLTVAGSSGVNAKKAASSLEKLGMVTRVAPSTQERLIMNLLGVLVVGLSAVCIGTANAAPARDALKGFNGVDFGTTLDAAQALLGADVHEGKDSATPPNRMLSGKIRRFGEELDVQYSFKNEGLFSNVTAKVLMPANDADFCVSRWSRLEAQLKEEFGDPDEEKVVYETVGHVTFNFADGSVVKANHMNCSIYISFRSPPAK